MTEEEREKLRQQEEIEDLTKDQRTVFVSQLVMKADERGVKKFFEKIGKVKSVIMIRDKYTNRHKGFCYVEMKELESIPLVLMLNGTVPDFQKFPILVKASEAEKNFLAKQEAAAAAETGMNQPQNRIYVGNLHVHLGEEDLRTVLQPFGEIESVHLHRDEVGTSKGYAFVKFLRSEDAATALQKIGSEGLELVGKAIKVGYVTDQTSVGVSGASGNWKLDDDEGTGLQMNAQSRVALMARLGQSAGLAPPAASMPNPAALAAAGAASGAASGMVNQDAFAAARALAAQTASAMGATGVPAQTIAVPQHPPPVINGPPSIAVIIKNMFDPASETDEGWDLDIKEDTEQECSKFGTVLHCYVDPRTPAGLVYILFSTVDAATKAAQHLNGRWFAGRTIAVEFMSPDQYAAQVPGATEAVATARATSSNAGA